uniref:Large ribosomal subunit protein uL6 alpha-beta domain-containing protein n=1 Tax=Euplotes harpa TaxID=151035 RepID=A0A7S3JFP6_9SPIT|mmetsp:Transcript_3818/g.4655  ORF Transcript_3818/g.4655 Transcript_3818/m.4655 type:complete len:197 (+) Transcript_3818:48-638(+)|eukprot:CAMPEP_0168323516 /NCGR_PEP_ID=MMETSP0213-20121227/3527_1 /TAXON_ID=151035 /ORGANISM="Euplotes harpa, Strain FSP1.4" /LENGTH=196 /DNA_ID=CAMNT_0008325601 /DNA_START=21 /DNA_END=611 /DNA_ORIENTATION=-
MKYLSTTQNIVIPDGVKVTIRSRVVTAEGPKGKVTKDLSHLPLEIKIVDSQKKKGKKEVSITKWFANYKQRTTVQTCHGVFRNMFNGVTRGFRYRMRCVNAHFPIKIFIAKDKKSVEFKNFLGGTQPQTVILKPGCVIDINPKLKDEIIVDGVDVDYVSQSCALINQCVNVGNKDVRKFLDGIYISEKTFQDAENE